MMWEGSCLLTRHYDMTRLQDPASFVTRQVLVYTLAIVVGVYRVYCTGLSR